MDDWGEPLPAEQRTLFRFLPTVLAVHRATSVFDIGLAVTSTVLGAVLGLLTALVLTCWRITTPAAAPPLSAAVLPIGLQRDG